MQRLTAQTRTVALEELREFWSDSELHQQDDDVDEIEAVDVSSQQRPRKRRRVTRVDSGEKIMEDQKSLDLETYRFNKAVGKATHRAHFALLCVRVAERSGIMGSVASRVWDALGKEAVGDALTLTGLQVFVQWFRAFWRFKGDLVWESSCLQFKACLERKLLKCLDMRRIGPEHSNILFAALCRARGIPCRLVYKLFPISHIPSKIDAIRDNAALSSESTKCQDCVRSQQTTKDAMNTCSSDESDHDFESPSKRASKKSARLKTSLMWVEVFVEDENRWVHVDVFHDAIDEAKLVDPKGQCLFFIGARDERLKDVTKRYAPRWSVVVQKRSNPEWYENLFPVLRDSLEDYDNDEMDANVLSEPIPSTLSALKNHPLYAIEKHLKKYEVIYPGTVVLGQVGQYKVFPRDNVHILRSKERWIREMRQVRASEQPVKSVPSKFRKKEEGDADEGTDLYGYWQTDPWTPGEAQDGLVPKNDRGNVDLWTSKHLPKGTVHIALPRVVGLAKKLGIDYAPAMIGFELKRSRWVPKIDGIFPR